MYVGTWDLGDLEDPSTYERRTGQVANMLTNWNMDIVAVSATQYVVRDYPIEQVGGYTFFWNGSAGEKRHIVGFAVKDAIADKLMEKPNPISENVLTIRLPMQKERFAIFVSVYGPAPDDGYRAKTTFYDVLDRYLSAIPERDKLFLMGNFNATVGKLDPRWEGVLGEHGLGIPNSTGHSLLDLCSRHKLRITNTAFDIMDRNKVTWFHARAGEWLMVDHVIVQQKFFYCVLNTRSLLKTDVTFSYHRLVSSTITIAIDMIYDGSQPFVRKRRKKPKQQQQSEPAPEKDLRNEGKKPEDKREEQRHEKNPKEKPMITLKMKKRMKKLKKRQEMRELKAQTKWDIPRREPPIPRQETHTPMEGVWQGSTSNPSTGYDQECYEEPNPFRFVKKYISRNRTKSNPPVGAKHFEGEISSAYGNKYTYWQ